MNFMCHKHKNQLKENPASALGIWSRLIYSAREKAQHEQWREAVNCYGNALDTAEVILMTSTTPCPAQMNRYLNTVIEFIYILRCCDDHFSTEYIEHSVQRFLQSHLYPADIQLLMKPIRCATDAPIHLIKQRMQRIFLRGAMQKSTVH